MGEPIKRRDATALAHDCDDAVRAAYNSALYLERRRRMLQDWATHIEALKNGQITGTAAAWRGLGHASPKIEHASLLWG